jgi:hypothetical protein
METDRSDEDAPVDECFDLIQLSRCVPSHETSYAGTFCRAPAQRRTRSARSVIHRLGRPSVSPTSTSSLSWYALSSGHRPSAFTCA